MATRYGHVFINKMTGVVSTGYLQGDPPYMEEFHCLETTDEYHDWLAISQPITTRYDNGYWIIKTNDGRVFTVKLTDEEIAKLVTTKLLNVT